MNNILKEAFARGLTADLKAHQQNAVNKLVDPTTAGLILNHGLGSGKTFTSIAAANALGMDADVFVPASLQRNYADEVAKFTDPESSVNFNIRSLQNLALHPENIKGDPNKLLIVDEAHRLRNRESKLWEPIRASEYGKKMLLSATPMYNTPDDLVSIAGLIGAKDNMQQELQAANQFERAGTRPLNVHNNTMQNILQSLRSTNLTRGIRKGLVSDANEFVQSVPNDIPHDDLNQLMGRNRTGDINKNLQNAKSQELKGRYGKLQDELQKRLISLSGDKVDLYEIPADSKDFAQKVPETVEVPMSVEQEELYSQTFSQLPQHLQDAITAGDPENIPADLYSNPFLIKSRIISNMAGAVSPKIDKMVEDAKATKGNVLMYSNFLSSGGKALMKRLDKEAVPYGVYTGEQSQKEKKAAQDAYNRGDIKVLIVSSAGGEGLSLKNTALVQIMEPHWNDEKINQVIGRAVRYQSHSELPEDQRKVNIKQYVSTSNTIGRTADQYLKQISGYKQHRIESIKELLRKGKDADGESWDQFAQRIKEDPSIHIDLNDPELPGKKYERLLGEVLKNSRKVVSTNKKVGRQAKTAPKGKTKEQPKEKPKKKQEAAPKKKRATKAPIDPFSKISPEQKEVIDENFQNKMREALRALSEENLG